MLHYLVMPPDRVITKWASSSVPLGRPTWSRSCASRRPTWLVQLPWLLTDADHAPCQYELQGATRERMLRGFAEVVGTLTATTPLLLLLEDLYWSDTTTLDLLALLARWRAPARLFVLGTYRPVEVICTTIRRALSSTSYAARVRLRKGSRRSPTA